MTPAHRGGRHRVSDRANQVRPVALRPSNDRNSSGRSAAQAATRRRTPQIRIRSIELRSPARARNRPIVRRVLWRGFHRSARHARRRQGPSRVARCERERRTQAAFERRSRSSRTARGNRTGSSRAEIGIREAGARPFWRPPRRARYRRPGPARAARRARSSRNGARAIERSARRPGGRERSRPACVGWEQAHVAQSRRAQPHAQRHPIPEPPLSHPRCGAGAGRAEGASVAASRAGDRRAVIAVGQGADPAGAQELLDEAATGPLHRSERRAQTRRGPGRVAGAPRARACG